MQSQISMWEPQNAPLLHEYSSRMVATLMFEGYYMMVSNFIKLQYDADILYFTLLLLTLMISMFKF